MPPRKRRRPPGLATTTAFYSNTLQLKHAGGVP